MLMSFSTQTVRNTSKNLYQRWFPQVGISLDWAGLTCCVQLKPEGLSVGLDESQKSKLERLSFLPRSSFSFQMNTYCLEAKSTPISETLTNLRGKELTWTAVNEVLNQQLKEVKTPEQVWERLNKTSLPSAEGSEVPA
jgi:hypothetical protein